jgi:hypothetical protein
MENGVTALPKLRPGVGAVDVDDDIGRIEQNDQVLREIGQRIYLQVHVRQQHRSGFSDAAAGANHGVIDISQRPRIRDRRKIEFTLSGSSLERLPRRLIGAIERSTRFRQRGHK